MSTFLNSNDFPALSASTNNRYPNRTTETPHESSSSYSYALKLQKAKAQNSFTSAYNGQNWGNVKTKEDRTINYNSVHSQTETKAVRNGNKSFERGSGIQNKNINNDITKLVRKTDTACLSEKNLSRTSEIKTNCRANENTKFTCNKPENSEKFKSGVKQKFVSDRGRTEVSGNLINESKKHTTFTEQQKYFHSAENCRSSKKGDSNDSGVIYQNKTAMNKINPTSSKECRQNSKANCPSAQKDLMSNNGKNSIKSAVLNTAVSNERMDCGRSPKGQMQNSQYSAACSNVIKTSTTPQLSDAVKPKRSRKRPSKVKRQAAHMNGKLHIMSSELHSRITNQMMGSEGVRPDDKKKVFSDINSFNDYPELMAAPNSVRKTSEPMKQMEKSTDKRSEVCDENQSKKPVNIELEHTEKVEEKKKGLIAAEKCDNSVSKTSENTKELVNNKVKICPRDPVNLFDLLTVAKSPAKHSVATELIKDVPASSKKNRTSSHAPNVLDASAPLTKRGKEREIPKPKKPTALKKIIMLERAEKRKKKTSQQCQEKNDDGGDVLYVEELLRGDAEESEYEHLQFLGDASNGISFIVEDNLYGSDFEETDSDKKVLDGANVSNEADSPPMIEITDLPVEVDDVTRKADGVDRSHGSREMDQSQDAPGQISCTDAGVLSSASEEPNLVEYADKLVCGCIESGLYKLKTNFFIESSDLDACCDKTVSKIADGTGDDSDLIETDKEDDVTTGGNDVVPTLSEKCGLCRLPNDVEHPSEIETMSLRTAEENPILHDASFLSVGNSDVETTPLRTGGEFSHSCVVGNCGETVQKVFETDSPNFHEEARECHLEIGRQQTDDAVNSQEEAASVDKDATKLSEISKSDHFSDHCPKGKTAHQSSGNLLSFKLADHTVSEELTAAIKIVLHTKNFRSYCYHLLSKELDECAISLLNDLYRFQDRVYKKDPTKVQTKRGRRLVYGIKEVTKHLKLGKLKCVVVAPNMEDIKTEGGLNDTLTVLIRLCRDYYTPCVFAANRKRLGQISFKPVPVSCIGIFNYEGSEAKFKKMISCVDEGLKDYKELHRILEQNLSQDDVNDLLSTASESPQNLFTTRKRTLQSAFMAHCAANKITDSLERFTEKYTLKV